MSPAPLYDATLTRAEWTARRAAHRARVHVRVEDHLARAAKLEKHPVYDFLFEYYSFPPAQLRRWSPGVGVRLDDATPGDLEWPAKTALCPGGAVVPAAALPATRLTYLRWAVRYLEETGRREPQFGCFGMHEWAMVFGDDDAIRHRQIPLRMSRADTDALVATGPVRCTHFDAFRFFTPAAVPLNRHRLTREAVTDSDQPGCVHVTMDLYKFAFVIAPFSSAETVADAFELAVAARELDMRASPYDLSALGFAPVRVETRDGREEYVAAQRDLTRRAGPVRDRVLSEYQRLERLASEAHSADATQT